MNRDRLFPDDPEYADASLSATTREHVEALWARYRPHAEPDFQALIRADFIEKFTEMFVACHLLELGWKVTRTKGGGPDFRVEMLSGSFNVEVTAPECGKGRGRVAPPVCDGRAHLVETEEMDFRLANAVERKAKQLGGGGNSTPSVLFVNMARAQHGWLAQEPHCRFWPS